MKDTLSFLVQSLLQKNNITIDREELDFQIQSHPSYPSLHAITGVLTHFDIENTAIRVNVDKETLEQLPTSYIAQIKSNGNTEFVLILNKGKNYKLIFSNKKSETVSETNFLEQFTGILVAVEKEKTKNTNKTSTSNFQKSLFTTAFVLFAVLFFIYSPNLIASIHFTLSFIGIGISFLIIRHDLGLSSKIIDRICSQESKTTNCDAVLNSKGAMFYKGVKLSDASLIYFVSISMASLFLSLTNTSFNVLYITSLTAIPVIVYSIYYQVKISKNWCTLCLAIVSILVLQASFFFFTKLYFNVFSIESWLLIGFSFIIITSVWLFINSKLKQEQEFKKLKVESTKFKRNFDLFNTILEKSESINLEIKNTAEIVLGNKNAILNITVITNPFCGHCKSVHHIAEAILKKHSNEVSITIRFNVKTNNEESKGLKVSSRLIEVFHEEGEIKCLEAMSDIYGNNDIKSWINKWGECNDLKQYTNTLKSENKWCLDNNINFTPEILINGKSFPKAYKREDLLFFIEDLNEYIKVLENELEPLNTSHLV